MSIYLGYDQLTPVLELEQMTYTFDDNLTPSASTLVPATITTSEVISIGGTNFGNSVKIFLRNKNAPSMRKRRSLPEPLVEPHVVKKREIHDFWTKFTNSEEPTWKCMHGKQCNHDDVSFMPSSLDRKKREIPENWSDIKQQEAEDDEEVLNAVCMVDASKCNDMLNDLFSGQSRHKRSEDEYDYEDELSAKDDQELLDAICRTDVLKCNEMLNNMFSSRSQFKRSANEAKLLEMALLTEGTYQADVVSVDSTSITFLPPALPAGEYDIIINVEGQGNAVSSTGRLTSTMAIDSVTPDTGSECGGQAADSVKHLAQPLSQLEEKLVQ